MRIRYEFLIVLIGAFVLAGCGGGAGVGSGGSPSGATDAGDAAESPSSPADGPSAGAGDVDYESIDVCELVPLADVVSAAGGKDPDSAKHLDPSVIWDCTYRFRLADQVAPSGIDVSVELGIQADMDLYRSALGSDTQVQTVSGLGDAAFVASDGATEVALWVQSGDLTVDVSTCCALDQLPMLQSIAGLVLSRL